MYNKVWEEDRIPVSWKEAAIVPIRQPGRDATTPTNKTKYLKVTHT